MLSPFLFSAAGGLAVYWSPPASEEEGSLQRLSPTTDEKKVSSEDFK